MVQREFHGELLVRGDRVPVRVSFSLTLDETENRDEAMAELGLRLALPDGGLFHCSGLLTRRMLTTASRLLGELASGLRQTAYVEDYDYYFTLVFDRIAGNETQAAVSGKLYQPRDDTSVGRQWKDVLRKQGIEAYPRPSLQGLVMALSDVAGLASMFREFLDQAGDALPEESPYD